ncbi:hypothetical protein ACN47E_005990 [Coniothyrium glycines]
MAPYALTPTTERNDFFDSSHGDVQSGSLTAQDTSTGRTSNEADISNIANHVRVECASNYQGERPTIASTMDSLHTDHVPSEVPSYEAAYIHGYKEGYTSGYGECHTKLKTQPIAIIGMSCRLPGSVSTPEEFWELLARSRTGFTAIPQSRFSSDRFFHPNPGKSGTTNAAGGNFLTHDLTAFDAPFFGFTHQEAVSLDPQQRLLLECTFEALESAGVRKQDVTGTDMGVFVGGTFSEYEADLFRDPETIPMHQATGCAMAMQSNRISHFFDFRGPSFTVDTACSSSLVALHAACQSIRSGESSMAIAAGVHLNMLPEFWISYSMSRLFGEAGRSFAFDQRGTGYGRGEGCCMVLLKPLNQAIKDNDPIRAVITGTGINQDGRTPGITMPNGSSQEALIRSVYTNGGMDPRDTGYVEAHGTGTRVGDPIEVGALYNVFGEARNRRNPLYIGSVKSNIGHLEAAAGIAGVIKTALMLERGFILPNYDFKQPNEMIPFDKWGLKVPVRQLPWPYGKRWASVNGFGFGGTNGHVVMTRGPLQRKTMKSEIDTHVADRLFVISAHDKASTEKVMHNLGVYLEQRPEVFQNDLLSNLAYTLGQRRSLHPWRAVITASSGEEIVQLLAGGNVVPVKQESELTRLGWIFTGQGAQWWAMGRELYHEYPVYASALDRADKQLRSLGASFSLVAELELDELGTRVNLAHISQPACTAVQLALVDLLKAWGIRPSAVAGHSSGEIGAAYAANMITFDDAMTIAYHRGRLIPILKKKFPLLNGCMMAIGAGKQEINPLLARIPPTLGEVRVACINSPSSVTVSGDAGAVAELQILVEEAYPGIFARKLQIETAYHSHHMNLVAKDYAMSLGSLCPPQSCSVKFHSSLLGRTIEHTELDATYWVQNLVCAVRFDDAVQSMCKSTDGMKAGIDQIIEIGPHAALQGPVKQVLKHLGGAVAKVPYASALQRKKNSVKTMLALAGSLFLKGIPLDMAAINFPKSLDRLPQVLTDLPQYSWNHTSKYYHESRFTKIHKFDSARRHDLIGILAPSSDDFEPTWRNVVRLDDLPWLRQYQMQNVTIFPISCFVIMALEAMLQLAKRRSLSCERLQVTGLEVIAPAMLDEEDLEMVIILRPSAEDPAGSSIRDFHIRSYSKTRGWSEHCVGSIRLLRKEENKVDSMLAGRRAHQRINTKIASVSQTASKEILSGEMYAQLSNIGVSYGPLFQGLEDCRASECAALAKLNKTDTFAEMPHQTETEYILHPVLLEQLITMYWPVFISSKHSELVQLPASIGSVTVSLSACKAFAQPTNSLRAFCEPQHLLTTRDANTFSMFAIDATGDVVVSVDDLVVTPLLQTELDIAKEESRNLCYKLEWEAMPPCRAGETVVEGSLQLDAEVMIVHGETDNQLYLAANLADRIGFMTGHRPMRSTIRSLDTTSSGKLCIFILELEQSLLAELDAHSFTILQQLLIGVQGLLWVVTGGYINSTNPVVNMVSGLARTLRSEGTLMKFITLDLDPLPGSNPDQDSQLISDTFLRVFATDSKIEETEFRGVSGTLLTPRIVCDPITNEFVHTQVNPPKLAPARFSNIRRPLKGQIEVPGVFESLQFSDDHDHQASLHDSEVRISVQAFSIRSEKDRTDPKMGLECSGIIHDAGSEVSHLKSGDRVVAFVPQGSMSTITRVQSHFVCKLPNHITFATAAAMLNAYCTVIVALIEQAKLSDGEHILIHDAGTAVGQAAFAIAQILGAEAWLTVRTLEEKELLVREFGVSQDRIWSTESEAFVHEIHSATQNRGVDVVLNTSNQGRIMRSVWKCLSAFGRVVNIGVTQNTHSKVLSEKHATLYSLDLSALADNRPQVLGRALSHISRLLQLGMINPLPKIETYGISECAAALQTAKSKGIGANAVIVPHKDEDVMAPKIEESDVILKEAATYVLIGGTGGLGRSIAKWMVTKGAKNIVLLSRSGWMTSEAKGDIDQLNSLGANIVVRKCDVANRGDVDRLMSVELGDLPPVRGIVHGAMVLHDVLFEQMTFHEYSAVISSKVHGARNFHHAISRTNTTLDFFVVISSAAGTVGNRGQAAYAAANTFLNGFAQQLRSEGINAASLDLTAVSDVGYLAEDTDKAAEVARNLGSDTICGSEVLALLRAAIEGKLETCNGHPITGMRITNTMRPFWSNDAKFVHLLRAAEATGSTGATTVKLSWKSAFKTATSRPEAEQVVCDALVEKIAEVISMEPEELDKSRPLSHYPLDSLTAIELRNFITRMFESNLQVLELLASGSIENLAKAVCNKSKIAVPVA